MTLCLGSPEDALDRAIQATDKSLGLEMAHPSFSKKLLTNQSKDFTLPGFHTFRIIFACHARGHSQANAGCHAAAGNTVHFQMNSGPHRHHARRSLQR